MTLPDSGWDKNYKVSLSYALYFHALLVIAAYARKVTLCVNQNFRQAHLVPPRRWSCSVPYKSIATQEYRVPAKCRDCPCSLRLARYTGMQQSRRRGEAENDAGILNASPRAGRTGYANNAYLAKAVLLCCDKLDRSGWLLPDRGIGTVKV
jgi:hypothetical protein